MATEKGASEKVSSSEDKGSEGSKAVAEQEDEPPAKRAKTPSPSAKGKEVLVTVNESFEEQVIIVPKRLDFALLK